MAHQFYLFHLINYSWCLDVSVTHLIKTPTWVKRTNTRNGIQRRYRGESFTTYAGQVISGDFESPLCYVQNTDTYTDNGDLITRTRQSPHISSNLTWLFHRMFQLDCEVGVGTLNDEFGKRNPQVMLQWSDNGGKTWSNIITREIGKIGEYNQIVKFLRLGKGRNRVYKVSFTDPVKFNITGAIIDISGELINQGR